jgi:hypothetical protein
MATISKMQLIQATRLKKGVCGNEKDTASHITQVKPFFVPPNCSSLLQQLRCFHCQNHWFDLGKVVDRKSSTYFHSPKPSRTLKCGVVSIASSVHRELGAKIGDNLMTFTPSAVTGKGFI